MRPVVIAIILLLSFALTIEAQDKPTEPYSVPTPDQKLYPLSSYLESKFQDQLSSCMGKKYLKAIGSGWLSREIRISAIPQPLLNDGNVRLTDQVLPELNESVARAFAYVYRGTSIQERTVEDAFLDMDYLQEPESMLPLGLNSTLYNYSCSANIAWALKSDGGYKWPIAEISAALQADYSNTKTAQLGLIFGTFRSPLHKMYFGADNTWQTYGSLIIWEWYSQNPSKLGSTSPGYLLKQFDGVSAYRLYTNKQTSDGKIDFSAKLASPVVSVDTSGKTQYESSEWIRAENFSVAANATISDANFVQLPASANLNRLPTSAKLDASSTDGRLLTTPMKHAQILPGVPPQWCQSDRWHLVNHHKSTVGDLHLVKGGTKSIPPAKGSAGIPPSCSFLIEYSNPVPVDKVTLSYSVVSTIGNNDDQNDDNSSSSAPSNSVWANTDEVRLSATGKPTIESTASHGIYHVRAVNDNGKNFHDFSWDDLRYTVEEDSQDRITAVKNRPGEIAVTILCGTDNRQIRATPVASYDQGSGTLLVKLQHSANDDVDKLDLNNNDELCVLTGSVTFTLFSGVDVPKSVPTTNIYFPKAASIPANVVISTVDPSSGAAGAPVIITGTGLTHTSKVTFSGIVASFTVNSDTRVTAVVPAGAQTGKIQINTAGGTASSTADFVVAH